MKWGDKFSVNKWLVMWLNNAFVKLNIKYTFSIFTTYIIAFADNFGRVQNLLPRQLFLDALFQSTTVSVRSSRRLFQMYIFVLGRSHAPPCVKSRLS